MPSPLAPKARRSAQRLPEFPIWPSTPRTRRPPNTTYKGEILGAAREADPENPRGVRYAVDAIEFIEVLPLPTGAGINRLDHAAFNTDSAEGMRKYLAAKGWTTPATITHGSDGSRWFAVLDPEGNKIQFVQPPANAKAPDAPNAIGHHIIHVGFLVRDRTKEDTFYRGLLGFRPYWYGGMQDDKVDWVSQQTPDSHDWLWSTCSPAGLPRLRHPRERLATAARGVLDHFLHWRSLPVPDAYKQFSRPASGSTAGTIPRPKSARTGNISSTCTTPTAFVRS